MIPHQTEGVHLPISFGARLAQAAHEQLPIRVMDDNIFLAVAAIRHVIYRPFVLDPWLAWHGQNPPKKVDI